ncbi:hypothetical protein GCM10027051_26700 [Niabella terrae]
MNFRIPKSQKLLIALLLLALSTLQAQRRPNIVLFISDDLNQQDLGCYGNRDVHTPHIDQLAAEGLRFTRAYAASSMCTPSRAVMFTGLYPYKNGVQMNHFTVKSGIRSLPHYLKELGYRVVISGKVDVSPLSGFPFEVTGEEFGKYFPVENRTDRRKASVHLIRDHFRTRSDQPLCLIVAPWLPHVPWFPHKDFDPGRLRMPDYLADTKETRSALASYYQSISTMDQMVGEVNDALAAAGQKDNTVFMFTSDQGAQFPGAKWTTYDQGLRVPFIVRWPGKIARKSISDALISLVDITPTMIDLAGGQVVENLDGLSVRHVFEKNDRQHHDFVFAETSVEPHYWYNYTPARSVITSAGWHYIRNYHPGVRFITHIDHVERNEYYFDSWLRDAQKNKKTKFLLDRYSYRPPEELYDLNTDREEFQNLAGQDAHQGKLSSMRALLEQELNRQGETEAMIKKGSLPRFFDRSYTIEQNESASDLSFNRKKWNPDTLYITAYLEGFDKGGIVCDYFHNFRLFAFEHKIGIELPTGSVYQIEVTKQDRGQLLFRLTEGGALQINFDNRAILNAQLSQDLTKIKGGYVSCGKLQDEVAEGRLQPYEGQIRDLRFTMNDLSGRP